MREPPRQPAYALWDRVHDAWGDADPGYGIHAWQDRQWRLQARTEAFDAAADGLAPEAPLGAEYAARVAALRLRADPPPPNQHPPKWDAYIAFPLRILAAEAPLIIMTIALGSWVLAVALAPLFLAVPFAVMYAQARRPLRRFITALDRRTCPDCGYDLSGAAPALDLDDSGADPGPRACPECGAPWPLLPPPATAPQF